MKNLFRLFLILVCAAITCSTSNVFSQSLGVNTTGNPAHPSAILDVTSTEKGVLVPRMTKAEKLAIPSPAAGLLVYQNGPDSAGFHYFNGTQWQWLSIANKALDTLAWLTGGNVGLHDTSFIGHRDNRPLNFRVNNIPVGRLSYSQVSSSFGRGAGHPNGVGHVSIGDSAGASNPTNTPGVYLGYRSGILDVAANNVFVGPWAGESNTTGGFNVFAGLYAGRFNETGNSNVYLGSRSGYGSTTGAGNVGIGDRALRSVMGATLNTAIGYRTMYSHNRPGASYNTAVGGYAMENDTAGYANSAFGISALRGNQSGQGNTAIGSNTMFDHIRGDVNTAVGYESMRYDTASTMNTAVGWRSLRYNKSGSENTALGVGALEFTDSSHRNTAVGRGAMIGVTGTSGLTMNVAVGYNAGGLMRAVNHTTIMGAGAGWNNQSDENVFIGFSSGYGTFGDVTGKELTGLGTHTLFRNQSGYANTAVGLRSLYNNRTGSNNVAIGVRPMLSNISGFDNIAIGDSSIYYSSNGNNNIAVGKLSLYNNTFGFNNIAIGNRSAQFNYGGNNNILIGHDADVQYTNLTNATAIGNHSYVSASNRLVLGSIMGVNGGANNVNVGIGISNPQSSLHIYNNQSQDVILKVGTVSTPYQPGLELIKTGTSGSDWKMNVTPGGSMMVSRSTNDFTTTPISEFEFNSVCFRPATDNSNYLGYPSYRWIAVYAANGTIQTSDARDKKDIETLDYGLKELMQLRPVSYHWKNQPQLGRRIGFIAQEVEPVLKEVVVKGMLPGTESVIDDFGKTETSDKMGVFYSDIIPVTVKAIQEQQNIISQQQQEITNYKKELENQQKEIDQLKLEMAQIKKKLGI